MSQEQTPAQNGALPLTSNMTDEEVMVFTRNIRVSVVNDLMAGGKVSGENSDRILLTNMLSGLESQAINSQKLRADQKNADNTAAIVADLLRNINKNTAFQSSPGNPNGIIDVEVKVVPQSIPDVPALPGEMDVCPPQQDYNAFVRSQGKDVDQLGKDVKHPESNPDEDNEYI